MSSPFRNSMMLYRPSLSVWTARKKDKDQSDKANKDAGAVDGAANVYKALLPESDELQAVQKWATAFRSWVYATTLPWDDNGGRVARVEKHMDFMTEAGSRMQQGDELVNTFMDSYARAIEEAKFKLNGMFNALDYPTPEQVRRKFFFTIECEAVPEAADFRIIDGLPPEEVERLVADASSGIERRIAGAMEDLRDRLYEVVVKFAETLTAYGNKEIKKFNDTLQSNVVELATIVPSLNLTNDATLAALGADALKLGAYDLKDLRKDDAVRSGAIAEARALAARFAPDAAASAWAQAVPINVPAAKTIQRGAESELTAAIAEAVADASPSSPEPAATDPASLTDGW